MTERHFHEQLQSLKERLMEMAALVEDAISKSIQALVARDDALAENVVKRDDAINRLEITIDHISLRLLALQQPMAVDLRFITSAMKINNDLERMGDHAVNIAQLAILLSQENHLKPLDNLPEMAEITQTMVRESLRSFVEADEKLARNVCRRDDDVDRFDDRIFHELLSCMIRDSANIPRAVHLVLISKNLERIADLSTNIAEEVIFIYKARNIKHHREDVPWKDMDIEDVRSRS